MITHVDVKLLCGLRNPAEEFVEGQEAEGEDVAGEGEAQRRIIRADKDTEETGESHSRILEICLYKSHDKET